MRATNARIAAMFEQVADLLELEGANTFRVRAYRNAARTVGNYARSMASLVDEGADLTALPGIGQEMANKIREIVDTDEMRQLEELKGRTPPSMVRLLRVEGLGPKRIHALHEALGITSPEELREAVTAGRLQDVRGFGARLEAQLLEALERAEQREERLRIDRATHVVTPLVEFLRSLPGVGRVEVAGSYRRRKETVGDLDMLVTARDGEELTRRFVEHDGIVRIAARGETRATVELYSGLQVDVRIMPGESYGAALLYFTGAKAHNIALRNVALERGQKLNEYGLFEGEERVAGETEAGIYGALELAFITPELREGRGEVQAAREGRLPQLVTLEDMRGDLQSHTVASDGKATIEEMAVAARARGYDYLAITDHSPHLAMIQGVDADGLARQMEEIARLNDELDAFHILAGVEVDILTDGSLDLPDDILSRLDLVVASIHSRFNLPRDEQTERIIRAMDNRHVHIVGHPTGRLIGRRTGYEVDMKRVMRAAVERGCYLEINAYPDRLDVDDVHAKMASEMGLKLAISTDAHRISELDYMRYGVNQARRGWLEPDDVLNSRPWPALKELLVR